jgi:hypothetical protein
VKFCCFFCPVKLGASGLRLSLLQASVNPKAESCEDLKSRRMRLHVGMGKLAFEDLERLLKQKEGAFKVV